MDVRLIIGLAVSLVIVIVLRYFIVNARDYSDKMISRLVKTDPTQALERLDNNKLFKIVFRKQLLNLYKLDCYMALGKTDDAYKTIEKLSTFKLNDHDNYEFLTKSFSFYLTNNYGEEAKTTFETTKNFLIKKKIDEKEPYNKILKDMEILVGVYVDKDIKLIDKLKELENKETKKHDKGLLEYRLAKLYHFANKKKEMKEYLLKAQDNLNDTIYAVIIEKALKDPSILDVK